jgi:hypothetical protein
MNSPLYSISGAARELGINRQTVTDVARCLGITMKRVELNGRAKGLDQHDLAILQQTLHLPASKDAKCPVCTFTHQA